MPLTSSERFQAGLSIGGAGLMGFQERLAEITRRKEEDEERRRAMQERKNANLALASALGVRDVADGLGDSVALLPPEVLMQEAGRRREREDAMSSVRAMGQLFPGSLPADLPLESFSTSTLGVLGQHAFESGIQSRAYAGAAPFLAALGAEAGFTGGGLENVPAALMDETTRGFFDLISQRRAPPPGSGGGDGGAGDPSEEWARYLRIQEDARGQIEQSLAGVDAKALARLGLRVEKDDKGARRLIGNIDAAISRLADLETTTGGAPAEFRTPAFQSWWSTSFVPTYRVMTRARGLLGGGMPTTFGPGGETAPPLSSRSSIPVDFTGGGPRPELFPAQIGNPFTVPPRVAPTGEPLSLEEWERRNRISAMGAMFPG